jgi:hypothetical protein
LNRFDGVHVAIEMVDEQHRRRMLLRDGREVIERIRHRRVGVIVGPAVATQPRAVLLLDCAKKQSHVIDRK